MAAIFYKEERLALFIDGANLHGAARALAFDIDFRRLFNLFARKGRLVRAFYYTTVLENQEYSSLRPLIDWLDYHSYTTVSKPVREYATAAIGFGSGAPSTSISRSMRSRWPITLTTSS